MKKCNCLCSYVVNRLERNVVFLPSSDLKPMTADVAGGLGLSNLHIHDNVGGLSTEDDLGLSTIFSYF